MNAQKLLVGEFIISVGFVSVMAMRDPTIRLWPWPGTLFRIAASFSVFGIVAIAVPELSAAFAGGLMLAAFLKLYSQKGGLSAYNGGVPDISADFPYSPLTVGSVS